MDNNSATICANILSSRTITSSVSDFDKRIKSLEERMTTNEFITNCKNCGAPLSPSGKCEYCGTVYRREYKNNSWVSVQVEHPQVHALKCAVRIDNSDIHHFGEDFIAQRTLREIRERMASQLVEFIRLDKHQDPYIDATMIYGTIRVVEPSFRF